MKQEDLNFWHIPLGMIFAIVVIIMMMCSCKSIEYVPVIEKEVHHDSIYFTKVQRDSVWLHDSISVKEKGDTVRIEHWHTQYRDRWRTDTIYQSKRDSIPYPVEVVKEVPAKLTWWQQTRLHLANIVLWLLALLAVIYVGKKHLGRLGQD